MAQRSSWKPHAGETGQGVSSSCHAGQLRACAARSRARRFQDFRTRLKATGVLLATFVTVDLGGYNNVAKSNILHTARDADKESDLWMEMLNGKLSHGGGRRIPGADLGDRNISALKAATVEDVAPDDLFPPALQVVQNSARLDL